MLTYLALRRLPQWLALSGAQRRFVWRHGVHPLLIRWPVKLAKSLLLFLLLMAAVGLGGFDGLVPTFITLMVVIFLLPELVDLWLVARHRQDILAYIHSHAAELQSVAS